MSIAHDIPYRGIVEQSLAGIYVIQDERFQYVNETFAASFGCTPDELIGHEVRAFVAPDAVNDVLDNLRRRIRGEVATIRYVARCQHKDGHAVYIEVHGTRLEYRGHPAVVGVGIDISERVRQDRALLESREQLRELAAYLNTQREQQRATFARELHDVLGGKLTALKMDLACIRRRTRSPSLAGMVGEVSQLVQDVIDTVHRIAEELRPSLLDHLGLWAAIDDQLNGFARRSEIACSLEPARFDISLSKPRALAVYRILQEALTNIARHAKARRVDVTLSHGGGQFRMQVSDDGCGFDPAQVKGKSLGLLLMSERARELDGTFEVVSRPGCGTRLLLAVPVAGRAETP